MRERLKERVKQSPLYAHIQVIRRAGIAHFLFRQKLLRRTSALQPFEQTRADDHRKIDCEVHMMVRASDVKMAIWSLSSLFHFSQQPWPVVFHQGGVMRPSDWRKLQTHFPSARCVDFNQATSLVNPVCFRRKLHQIPKERPRSPMLRKLVDSLILCKHTNVLLLDSDVLFFRKPHELIELASRPVLKNTFIRDQSKGSYNVSVDYTLERYGVTLPESLNAGMALLNVSLYPLDMVDQLVADPKVRSPAFFSEQTIQAIVSGKLGFQFFSDRYKCSTCAEPVSVDQTPLEAKHYIQTPRPAFFTEGVARLDSALPKRSGLTGPS